MRKITFLAAFIGAMAWTQAVAGDGTTASSDAAQDTQRAGQEAKQETQQAAGEAKQDTQQAAGEAKQQGQQVGRDASAEMQQSARAEAQGGQAKKSVVGEVKSIDEQKLTLENRLGETHDFALGADTKFMRDGKTVSRDEIQEGAQVRASFTGSENDLQATRIDVVERGGTGGESGSSSGSSSGSGETMGGSGSSSGSTGGSGDAMGGSGGSSGSSSGGSSPSGSDRQ